MLGKIIFDLSPIEKWLCDLTMIAVALLDFRALECRWTIFRIWNIKKIKKDNVLDHLKSRNGCSGLHQGYFGTCTTPVMLRWVCLPGSFGHIL